MNKETTVSQVADDDHISRLFISRCDSKFNRYTNQAFSGQGNRYPEQARHDALEAEVKRFKEENEILKMLMMFVDQEKK